MDEENKLLHSLLLFSAATLTYSYPSSIAYDRPVHAAVCALAVAGFLLLSTSRAWPGLFRPPRGGAGYVEIPLEDREETGTLREITPDRGAHVVGLGPRISRLLLIATVCALSVRIELFRHISKATECTVSSVEIVVPLVISIYDALRLQKPRHTEKEDSPGGNIYDDGFASLQNIIRGSRWRYVPSTCALVLGCYLCLGLWSGLNSTYICPLVVGETRSIPLMQWLGAALDSFLAIASYELCLPQSPVGSNTRGRGPTIWGTILITTAILWLAIGVIVYFAKSEYRVWLLPLELLFSARYLLSLLWQSLLYSALLVCGAHCILHSGILSIAMYLTALCVTIPCIKFLWLTRHPFPPETFTASTLSFLLIYFWKWSWDSSRHAMGVTTRTSTSNRVVLFLLLIILTYPGWWKSNIINFHPIDMLVYQAKSQHYQYRTDATRSSSLGEAVTQYRQRYSRNPPPGFDVWYQYATNRSSVIIDNYDQIHNDLLPLWALTPNELRVSTWEMVSNPWNEISGITVRRGVATVQDNVLPTHRWMLEGVAIFMNSFARYLPDMDLAFNLNDEPRVAIPYDDLMRFREQGRGSGGADKPASWSENRSDGWLAISEQDFPDTVFSDMSFRNTFAAYGSVGCPSSSMARNNPHVSSQSHICISCVAPHSLGQFISNWSLAADVCHQPDLAHLHGFYLSPAAFKASYAPRPVFSQSKPHGYNDILYPSAWNYMDKAVYHPTEPSGIPGEEGYNPGHPDPPFSSKHNVLFWRGATSEGVSSGDHSWRGMARQRLVHMTNNLTSSSHDAATIILPDLKSHSGKLKYHVVAGTKIKDLGLNTDIAIVDRIARCGGIGLHDCTDQEAEFALVPPSDFQDHWQYRYLFDLDGAGFSGRFLPFLQSRSLPFKTALFREWYDDRLTAWRHFVPLDLRLHGVWSTLAYFAGVNGKMNGREMHMGAHLKEGEMIAEEGRKWANLVLRKDDMEIYFFRLLLEWGRLTDDNRENLGFVP